MSSKRQRIPSELRLQIAAKQCWTCRHCGDLLQSTFEVDHIVPLHLGGSNETSNLQVLCCMCHALKSQKERIALVMKRCDATHCNATHCDATHSTCSYSKRFQQRWPEWARFTYPKLNEQQWFELYCRFNERCV